MAFLKFYALNCDSTISGASTYGGARKFMFSYLFLQRFLLEFMRIYVSAKTNCKKVCSLNQMSIKRNYIKLHLKSGKCVDA